MCDFPQQTVRHYHKPQMIPPNNRALHLAVLHIHFQADLGKVPGHDIGHGNRAGWCRNITGWWFEPLWKILVNWDDYSQYMGKSKMFQTTNQIISASLRENQASEKIFGALPNSSIFQVPWTIQWVQLYCMLFSYVLSSCLPWPERSWGLMIDAGTL